MKTGRNEPCPCGSGIKYKKCCLGREEINPAPMEQSRVAAKGPAPADAPPQGHGGGIDITAYTIAKIVEDKWNLKGPRFRRSAKRHLREGWTIARVAAMTTEAIEDQLRAYGVRHTRERYLRLAEGRTYAWRISNVWMEEDPITCKGFDEDFLGLAACELWKRFLPGRPSVEMLDDWMQEGYALQGERREVEACGIWLKIWRELLPRFTPDMRTMEDSLAIFNGMQSVHNWSQDFETCLSDAAVDDVQAASMGLQYCKEWLSQFTGEEDLMQVNFNRALAGFHFRLGEIEQGERVLHKVVERYPKDPWSYVALADAYSHLFHSVPGPPLDLSRAIRYLEVGIATIPPGDPDRHVLVERLEELRSIAGR